MIVSVSVTTKSPKPGVTSVDERLLKVRLKSPPEKGAANIELIERVAQYYSVRKSAVSIVSGFKSRKKRVEVDL